MRQETKTKPELLCECGKKAICELSRHFLDPLKLTCWDCLFPGVPELNPTALNKEAQN